MAAPAAAELENPAESPTALAGGEHALVGLVHLLNRDHFDIGFDLVLGTEVQHGLGFPDPADQRAGELPAIENEGKRLEGSGFGRGRLSRRGLGRRDVGDGCAWNFRGKRSIIL